MTLLIALVLSLLLAAIAEGRQAERPRVVYLPVTAEEHPPTNWGCLPLLLFALLAMVLMASLSS